MTQPLGEEFIKIRPDASTFRTELQAQISGALTGVQAQVNSAQSQMRAATNVSPGGVILPSGVTAAQTATAAATKTAAAAANTQAAAMEKVGTAAQQTNAKLQSFSQQQVRAASTTVQMERSIAAAETSVGRYSRGMLAATAASTGFFRAVSFASGAFLVGAAVGATIGAAVTEFSEMTAVANTTTRLIEATGHAANVTAAQVDQLATSTLKLTGIDDELVKQGANVLLTFRNIRNEVGRGNNVFDRATRAAADISTVFRTDIRGSAVQLGKALQDPVRGVTALRRSGISLTQGQRELIKSLTESGAILTAQKLILGEVERQVGGAAEAVGQTLPGQLRIMRETAVNALGEYVQRLSESTTAAELAADAAGGIRSAFSTVSGAVRTLGPGLVGVAQGLARITEAVGGAGNLLLAVGLYKAVTLGARLASTATSVYAEASAGAAQAALAEAQANGTATTALEAKAAAELTAARAAQRSMTTMVLLNGVLAAGAAASGNWGLALVTGGLAALSIAAKVRAAVVALRAAGTAVTAFSVASAALGGPVGLAAVGATALGVGLFAAWRHGRNAAGSIEKTKQALDGLNESLDTNMRLRAAVGTARERFGVAQFDVRGAERDLARAREKLSSTRAAPGSLEFRFLEQQITAAEENLTKAQNRLTQSQRALDDARERARIRAQGEPERVRALTAEVLRQVEAQRRAAVTPIVTADAASKQRAATENVQGLADRYRDLAESQKGAARAAAGAFATLLTTLNRLPTKKEIGIIVKLSEQGSGVNEITRALGLVTAANEEGGRIRVRAERSISASLREQFLIARGQVKAEREKFDKVQAEANKRKEVLATQKQQVASAREAVTSAREALAASRETLADAVRSYADAQTRLTETIASAHQSVADAIKQAHESVNESVKSAKSNFTDLASSIADTLGRFKEAVGETDRQGGPLSARFRELRDQLLAGGSNPLLEKAAQEIRFRVNQPPPADKTVDTDKIKQRFDDLTFQFETQAINLRTFNTRFSGLLRGVDLKAVSRVLGPAAAGRLAADIRAERQQALALARGPQRPGAAGAPSVVNPAQAVKEGLKAVAEARQQATKDIKAASRDVKDASDQITKSQQDVAKAVRRLALDEARLRKEQADATKAQTRAQDANTRAQRQHNRLLEAQNKLLGAKDRVNKPKGGGKAADDATAAAKAGAR